MKKVMPIRLILIYSSICTFLLAVLIFLISLVGFNNISGFYGGANKINHNEKGTTFPGTSDTSSPEPSETSGTDISPFPS